MSSISFFDICIKPKIHKHHLISVMLCHSQLSLSFSHGIKILHECEIEKSVWKITDWYHEAYVFVLSCVCYVFVRVCLYVLCGYLLGKG